jgi:hypothetical protein
MTFEVAKAAPFHQDAGRQQRPIITCSTTYCLNDRLFESVRNIDLKCPSQRLNATLTTSILTFNLKMSASKQPQTLEEMITILEDATWKVMEDRATDLEKFITQDCLFLFAGGLRLGQDTKPTLRESLRSEAYVPWTGHKMSDIEITLIGRDGAIITYKVEATRPSIDDEEEDDVFTALVSSTWRRDEDSGRLLMCHSQQTPF